MKYTEKWGVRFPKPSAEGVTLSGAQDEQGTVYGHDSGEAHCKDVGAEGVKEFHP